MIVLFFMMILMAFVVVASAIAIYILKYKVSTLEAKTFRRRRSEVLPSTEDKTLPLSSHTLPENPMANFLP